MDFKQIQTIIRNFEKSNMTVLEIEVTGVKIRLSKNSNEPVKMVEDPSLPLEPTETPNGYALKSPLVGTFYAASNPQAQPFVSVGQRVEKGQTVCIIEAMKIMNEISAPVAGIVSQINLEDGKPVGYDQIIMVIERE